MQVVRGCMCLEMRGCMCFEMRGCMCFEMRCATGMPEMECAMLCVMDSGMLGEMQCAMLGAIPEMRGVMFGMHETSETRAGTRGERGIETHEVCTTLETHVELVCRTSARAPSAFWGFRAICSWTICTGRH
jgi:hypothetical protein